MLWCALYLHQLPLEVFQRAVSRFAPTLSLAVYEKHRIIAASESAQALGVRSGIKKSTAMALVPDVILQERQLAKEEQSLLQVANWALQFTPSVVLQNNGLVLEIEPSLRLFGGLEHLLAQITEGIQDLGFSAHWACALTPHGAWLLAKHLPSTIADKPACLNRHLAGLPLTSLDSARTHIDTLTAMGARNLKDLVQLPRAGINRRFGKELLNELDRALGKAPDPRDYVEAPLRFQSQLELMAQVENAEALLFAARRMLMELIGWLNARLCAVRTFTLTALHDDRGPRLTPPTILTIALSEPSRELNRLTDVLREKLQVLPLPAPAHTLRLDCQEVHLLPAANGYLFMMPQSAQQTLGRLVEKLQARLGTEQVQKIHLQPDHRPEAAFVLKEYGAQDQANALEAIEALPWTHGLPRPLWLLPTPQAIEERNQRPFCSGPLSQGPLQILAGPERIEGGWWDSHFVQRDYFIAEDTQANLYWIFRERGNHKQNHDPGWFIQGRFG